MSDRFEANRTADPLMTQVRRAMDRLGFRLAGQNLVLNWPAYSQAEQHKIAIKWGVLEL